MIEVSGMGANPSRTWIITTYADSESRILTLGHPHKHCRTSLLHELGSGKSIYSTSQTKRLSFLHNSRVYVTSWTSPDEITSSSRILPSTRLCLCLCQIWACGLWVHFSACIVLTHPWSYSCSIFQHYTSFKSNSTSFCHTLGVTIVTKTKLQLICPNSNFIWNNIFLSIGQLFTQTSIAKKMHWFIHNSYSLHIKSFITSLTTTQNSNFKSTLLQKLPST